jgi:hypothetical protein
MNPEQETAVPIIPNRTRRWSWGKVVWSAISLSNDFEGAGELPEVERRRVGFAGIVIGAITAGVGAFLARWVAEWLGVSLEVAQPRGLIAAFGAMIAGMGTYQLASSFWPGIRDDTRKAKLARMFLVFVVLSAVGVVVVVYVIGLEAFEY